jgi:hypothetical protein
MRFSFLVSRFSFLVSRFSLTRGTLAPKSTIAALTLLSLAALPHTAQAQAVISNSLLSNQTFGSSLTATNNRKAFGFTTSATGSFSFTSLDITAITGIGIPDAQILGGIYSNAGGIPSATQLVAFNSVTVPTTGITPTVYTFTPVSAFSLSPSTTYWVSLFGASDTDIAVWTINASNNFPSVTGAGAGDISLVGYTISGDGGGTWGSSSISNALTITLASGGSSAPEPGTLALLALGIVGGVVARRRK